MGPRYDVWYLEDCYGWTLDTPNADVTAAAAIVANLRACGLRTHVAPHNPDMGTTDTSCFGRS